MAANIKESRILFNYHNVDGKPIFYHGSAIELWRDWWEECNLCPANDDIVENLMFYCDGIVGECKSVKFERVAEFLNMLFASVPERCANCVALCADKEVSSIGICDEADRPCWNIFVCREWNSLSEGECDIAKVFNKHFNSDQNKFND